jgi:TIR domain
LGELASPWPAITSVDVPREGSPSAHRPARRDADKQPETVFVSYAKKDKRYLDMLMPHLNSFVNLKLITVFTHDAVKPGDLWQEKTKSAILQAVAAILLITENYLASESLMERQLPQLLKQAERNGAIIIPLIVTPCAYEDVPHIYQFKSVNDPDDTLIGMTGKDRGKVLLLVARTAARAARERRAG